MALDINTSQNIKKIETTRKNFTELELICIKHQFSRLMWVILSESAESIETHFQRLWELNPNGKTLLKGCVVLGVTHFLGRVGGQEIAPEIDPLPGRRNRIITYLNCLKLNAG